MIHLPSLIDKQAQLALLFNDRFHPYPESPRLDLIGIKKFEKTLSRTRTTERSGDISSQVEMLLVGE